MGVGLAVTAGSAPAGGKRGEKGTPGNKWEKKAATEEQAAEGKPREEGAARPARSGHRGGGNRGREPGLRRAPPRPSRAHRRTSW